MSEKYPKQVRQQNSSSHLNLRRQERFEDTKGAIRSCKSKERQYNYQKIKVKGQTMVIKHSTENLRIEQHEPRYKRSTFKIINEILV